MGKQLGAVLGSYGQRCRTFLGGSFVALGLFQVVVTLCVATMHNVVNTMLPFIAMGVVFVGIQLWAHLREQILSVRRFTWPEYVVPHLVGFSILALPIIIAWPLAIAFLVGHSAVGLTALVLSIFAIIGWCVVTLSSLLTLLAVAGYLSICFGTMTAGNGLELDAHVEVGAAVLIASILLIIAAVFRLTRMTEASSNYDRRLGVQSSSLLPKMTGQLGDPRGKLSRVQLWFSPQIEQILPQSTGQWSRTRRWNIMRRSSTWFVGMMAVFMVAPQALVMHNSRNTTLTGSGLSMMTPLLWIYLFAGAGSVAIGWLHSWRYLDMEFVRPIARRMLLKDLGLAIASQTLEAWFIMTLVVLGACAFEGGLHQRFDLFAEVVGISFASQCLGLVLALLVMPFRSPGGAMLVQFGVSLPCGALVAVYFGRPNTTSWIAALAAAAMLFTAAALLPVAIRRWDVTDLG